MTTIERVIKISAYKKDFLDTFKLLIVQHQSWRVWSDFIEMTAIAIHNALNFGESFRQLEERYLTIINAYERRDQELFPKLLALIVQALDANPEQDFLGELFQELGLSSHWKGQFFTPYNVCKLIAELKTIDASERLKEKDVISVNDPACGAGALLIAFANAMKRRGINYQRHVLFVGQDIDKTAALMCYIQLSLLGCPGYVIVGDTLAKPGMHPDNEIWYTPMYFRRLSWGSRPTESEEKQDNTNFALDPFNDNHEIVQLTLF